MRKLFFAALLLAGATATATAAVGDTTRVNKIIEVKPIKKTNANGKESVTIYVVYINKEGKKALATITKTDAEKIEQYKAFGIDAEYYLVELKSKNKIIVK